MRIALTGNPNSGKTTLLMLLLVEMKKLETGRELQ